MTSAGTFWRTVRHLKPAQLLGRVRFRLARPRPDLRPAPVRRAVLGPWVPPAAREPSMVGPLRQRFLNVEHDIDNCGWDDPRIEKLWRYNQHYFDDLNAQGAADRHAWHGALVDRWLKDNPPASGTGWEPYPVSLRIVNWVKWFMGGTPPADAWVHSLAVQARWLAQRLEWHLLGNHLFINAKALICAGLFFQGAEAEAWLHKGLAIIDRQLPEQVLGDGGQFERSPMYHALALEDVLDLINLAAALAPAGSPAGLHMAGWRATAARMLFWMRCMAHPDGGLALFNDSAEGIAPPNVDIERYAAQLSVGFEKAPMEGVTLLAPSGYVRVAVGSAVALLDAAPIGPDYLPGHAHADTLSFELSVGQRRLVVNGGTSCYGVSARRLFERGTSAHSTVRLAGQDSSEVWSGFRVGRRAYPGPLAIDGLDVACSHDGYRHLAGAPTHHRSWKFGDGSMLVNDSVQPVVDDAVAHYHLAPGLCLQQADAGTWAVLDGERALAHVTIEVGQAESVPSLHAPRFGVLMPARCLAVKLVGGRASTHWHWDSDAHSLSER